jgi:hypothetical protein
MKSPVSRLAPSNCTSIAAALLIGLTAAGCATQAVASKPAVRPSPLPVTIIFTGSPPCPTDAVPDTAAACPDPKEPTKTIPSCLHARKGESVAFRSSPVGHAFTIYFDPFKKGALASNKLGALDERIDPDAPAKTYAYNVVSTDPSCRILDPIIIVQ